MHIIYSLDGSNVYGSGSEKFEGNGWRRSC